MIINEKVLTKLSIPNSVVRNDIGKLIVELIDEDKKWISVHGFYKPKDDKSKPVMINGRCQLNNGKIEWDLLAQNTDNTPYATEKISGVLKDKNWKDEYVSIVTKNYQSLIDKLSKKINNESINLTEAISVYGYDPSTDEFIFDNKFNDPAKAIEAWFKENQKNPTCIAIYAEKDADARKVLQWAKDNENKIKQWHSQYRCPYKLDHLLKWIDIELGMNPILRHPDQITPFSLG